MIKALFGASSELLQDRSSESIEDFVIVDDSESPAPKAAISAERPMQSPEDSPVKETQNKQAASDKTLMTAVPQKEISDQSQKMNSRDHYGEKSTQRASQTEPSMFSSKKLRSSGPRVSAKENLIASDNHSREPQSTPSLNETNMAKRDCSVTSRSIPVHRTLKHAALDESKSLPKLLGPPVPMSATVRSKISKETNIPTSKVESEERVGIQDTRNSARTSHHPAFHGVRRWSLPSGNDNKLPDDAVVNFDSDRPKIVDCIRAQSPRILTHEQRRSAEKARRDSDLLESVHYEKTSRNRAEGSARKSRESRGKTRSRNPEYTFPRYQNEFYQDLCGLCHFPVPEYQPYTVELAGIFYHKRCIAEHLFSSSELRAALRSRYEEPRRKRKHSRKCSVWQKMVKGISDFFKAK